MSAKVLEAKIVIIAVKQWANDINDLLFICRETSRRRCTSIRSRGFILSHSAWICLYLVRATTQPPSKNSSNIDHPLSSPTARTSPLPSERSQDSNKCSPAAYSTKNHLESLLRYRNMEKTFSSSGQTANLSLRSHSKEYPKNISSKG